MAAIAINLTTTEELGPAFRQRVFIEASQGQVTRSGAQLKADFGRLLGGAAVKNYMVAIQILGTPKGTTNPLVSGPDPRDSGGSIVNLIFGGNYSGLTDNDAWYLCGFDRARTVSANNYYLDLQPLLANAFNVLNAAGPSFKAQLALGSGIGVPSGDFFVADVGEAIP